MSKCVKCGKELQKDTQGTVCQECFWCDYRFDKEENKLKQDKYKQDLIERSLKDKIAVYLADTFLTFNVEMSNFCFEKILNNYIDFEMEIEQLKKENEELEEYYSLYEELLENKGTEADNINLKNDIEILKHKNFGWLRIQNLEKEVERLKAKLEIWNRFNKEDYIHKGEKATERDYYYYTNGASSVLEKEVEQLKTELAETNTKARELVELNLTNEMLIIDLKQQLAEKDKQLQNAVFPKFKVGDEVWFLYSTIYYLNKNKKDKICKGKITRVISYEIDNRDNLNVDNIFTKSEAEEALKKLEESNVKD